MRSRGPGLIVAALGAALAFAPAAHGGVQVVNVWMRPASAGAASADVYADLRTSVPVTLTGVRTSSARKVEIVIVDPRSAGPARVVESHALPAGETRFALRGSVLRLVDLKERLVNGSPITLRFEFVDAAGAKSSLEAPVEVRGLVAPPAAPPEAGRGASDPPVAPR